LKFDYIGTIENGHSHQVGLILSNDKGLIASFDESSLLVVWDVQNPCKPIHISSFFGEGLSEMEVFSMNIYAVLLKHNYQNRLITGGKDGKVLIWNCLDASLEKEIVVPRRYEAALSALHLLNVSMHEQMVVYGLYDGEFILCLFRDISTFRLGKEFLYLLLQCE
jgi:WD40 repeat protein